MEKTTKVSIDPRVQVERAIGVQDHAFVGSLFQAVNESLNGCCVTLFRSIGEAGRARNSMQNVRARVHCEAKEHSN